MQSPLRVKIKSLAAEARIIRHEERRLIGHRQRTANADGSYNAKRPTPKVRVGGKITWLRAHQAPAIEVAEAQEEYHSLHRHRTHEVRSEARYAQLAYAFIQGRAYRTVEGPTTRKPVVAGRLAELIHRFGGAFPKAVAQSAAEAWLTAKAEPVAA